MAEETLTTTAAATPATEVAVVETEKKVESTEVVCEKDGQTETEVTVETVKAEEEDDKEKVSESASFKEESNVAGDLPDPEKKALDELKLLVQEALNKHEFTAPPPPVKPVVEEKLVVEEKTPAVVEEETKASEEPEKAEPSEPKAECKVEETTTEPTPKEVAEPVKVPEPVKEATEPVKVPEPVKEPAEPVKVPEPVKEVIEVVVKTETSVDEDGSKKIEAIEETIIAVATSSETPVPETTTTEENPACEETPVTPEEVSIWGIPLLADERSDVVLLKFLRARDFKVKEAFTMLKNVVAWRKEFGIESLLEEDLGTEQEKVVYMHGVDKEGHPVCYNAYGEYQNKELYNETFSTEEKRTKFLRWRIQFLEKSIRKLDFSPDGICTIVQVFDLKNSPGPFKWELRQATNQALQLLQDNYPEFVAKQVFINVPFLYLTFYKIINSFFTQRTKSKFVFAGPSKTAETLFKYIAPELVPVQYGGLSREGEQEFASTDAVTEEIIKPATKHCIDLPATQTCTLVWEARVVGYEITYGAEFVPATEDGYTVIIQKSRKITATTDEPVISGTFKCSEPGKVVLTFDNQTSKKKKVLYRSKTKASSD